MSTQIKYVQNAFQTNYYWKWLTKPFKSNKLILVKEILHVITVTTQIAFWKSSIVSWDPFEQITYTTYVFSKNVYRTDVPNISSQSNSNRPHIRNCDDSINHKCK